MTDDKYGNEPLEPDTLEADIAGPAPDLVERGFTPWRLFKSLSHRDYRFFLAGAVLSNVGTWMQMIALGWLVYELTKSSLLVGLVNFAGNLPVTLIVLFAGVAADRLDRKLLIIWTQVVMLVLALILGFMTYNHSINIGWIIVLSIGFGLMTAVMFPAWQAILSDIVPRKDLMNAIAINSAQFHLARMLGPALAGLVLAAWGAAANFFINAVSFLAVILAMLAIHPQKPEKRGPAEGVFSQIATGISYARSKTPIVSILLSTGVITVFGFAYITLMPVFAASILHVKASGYGFLMAANGLGALVGALLVAWLAPYLKRETMIKAGTISFGLGLVVFSTVRHAGAAMIVLAIIGASFLVIQSSTNTSLQTLTPRHLRGRVMSLYVFMFMGMMPFSGLIFGAVGQKIGVPSAILIGGSVVAVLGLALAAFPRLLDQSEEESLL